MGEERMSAGLRATRREGLLWERRMSRAAAGSEREPERRESTWKADAGGIRADDEPNRVEDKTRDGGERNDCQ